MIMVVLSLYAEGTSYQDCADRVTTIARALYPSCYGFAR